MKKILIAGTIAFLTVTIVSSLFSYDTLLAAFTATDPSSQILKFTLISLLLGLLLTKQPRSIEFRTVLGVMSIVLLIGTAAMAATYLLPILDAVLYVEIAIILAIEALENSAFIVSDDNKAALKPTL